MGGMGDRVGLDYTACMGLLDRRIGAWRATGDVSDDVTVDQLMSDVQIIESAILGADHERRQRERDAPPTGSGANASTVQLIGARN